jgi:hypothetical protein
MLSFGLEIHVVGRIPVWGVLLGVKTGAPEKLTIFFFFFFFQTSKDESRYMGGAIWPLVVVDPIMITASNSYF